MNIGVFVFLGPDLFVVKVKAGWQIGWLGEWYIREHLGQHNGV